MKVIIREAAYDDLDRIYAWMPKTARAPQMPLSNGYSKAPNGSAYFHRWGMWER